MAKVIKSADEFKPVTCEFCGCVYEFEQGDLIDVETLYTYGKIINQRRLRCPYCLNWNKLESKNEK